MSTDLGIFNSRSLVISKSQILDVYLGTFAHLDMANLVFLAVEVLSLVISNSQNLDVYLLLSMYFVLVSIVVHGARLTVHGSLFEKFICLGVYMFKKIAGGLPPAEWRAREVLKAVLPF